MPNHVTTRITVIGSNNEVKKVLKDIKSDHSDFDFNQIISSPECLKGFEPHMGILARAENALGLPVDEHPLIADLQKSNRTRECFSLCKADDIPAVIRAISNFAECGHMYWHSWNSDNWGTKWNAYDVSVNDNEIKFDTAWSHPIPIIEHLSKKFPDIQFDIQYADEDIGSNCGQYSIKNNEGFDIKDFQLDWKKSTPEEQHRIVAFALAVKGYSETADEWLSDRDYE